MWATGARAPDLFAASCALDARARRAQPLAEARSYPTLGAEAGAARSVAPRGGLYMRPTNEPTSAAPGAEGAALSAGRENHFDVILRLLLKKLSAP